MSISNGLYEIRSLLLTSMCADISGGSTVKGANLQLYSTNDSNAQKFYIVEESAGEWSIQNAKSQLFIDVASGSDTDGTNVQQWTDNNTRAQRWKITDTGTTATVDGSTCKIVTIGSYVTVDGATFFMDVKGAMTTNSTNIQIYHSNGTDAQKFVLLPTTLLDTTMPVPSGIGWTNAIGASDAQTVYPAAATLYPAWYFTDAWDGIANHGFEYSYRSRLLPNDSATPGAWTDWTAWSTASVTLYGQSAWLTSGITGSFDDTTYKALEYSFRVRSTGTINLEPYHSSSVNMALKSVVAPTVSVTAAKLGIGEITLTMSTDYDGGVNAVNIISVTDSTGKEYLAKPLMGYGYGTSFDVDVPVSNLATIPTVGTALNVTFEVGTDQYPATGFFTTSSVTYSAKSNKSITVSPALTYNSDGTATVTVTAGSTRHAWLSAGGETVPLEQRTATTFILPYPFGIGCSYYVSVENASAWGNASGTITANDVNKIRPCHAFNWDGGYFLLEVADGIMQTSRTIKANYSAFELDNREWQSLKFTDTLGGEFKAEGVLKGGLTQSDKAALMALVKAHNVTYRAPSGEVAHVGITDVSYQTIRSRTMVSVSMVQVTR